jgi:hypothetical protein
MTSNQVTKTSSVEILKKAWGDHRIGKWSRAEDMVKLVDVEGNTQREEHTLEWFEDDGNLGMFKDILHRDHVNKLKEAAALLYREVNSSAGEAALVEALNEHCFLMDKFAWTVMKAIQEHAGYSNGTFDGRISVRLQDLINECLPSKKAV